MGAFKLKMSLGKWVRLLKVFARVRFFIVMKQERESPGDETSSDIRVCRLESARNCCYHEEDVFIRIVIHLPVV